MEDLFEEQNLADFPRADDELFPVNLSSTDHYYSAWMGTGPSDKFSMYAVGYYDGAVQLVNACITTGHGLEYLVYPAVFLYRQYIELRLKELISKLNYCLNETTGFPHDHSIERLWNTFEALFIAFDDQGRDEADFTNAKRIIRQFNSVDPGFAFRYPIDRQGNASLNMQYISLSHFAEVMQRLANFLNATIDYMEQYVDMADEMRRDFYSEIQREYM